MKDRAVLLYTMCSASLRSIGKLLGVSTVSVLRWIRQYARTLEYPKISPPKDGTIIVVDEMWHFVNGNPNKVWIWKAYDLRKRQTFAWKIGRRDASTLKEFLDEIGIEGCDFVTDNYEAYHQLIPEYQLFTGKEVELHRTFPSQVKDHFAKY
jgi:IS1 family transposase